MKKIFKFINKNKLIILFLILLAISFFVTVERPLILKSENHITTNFSYLKIKKDVVYTQYFKTSHEQIIHTGFKIKVKNINNEKAKFILRLYNKNKIISEKEYKLSELDIDNNNSYLSLDFSPFINDDNTQEFYIKISTKNFTDKDDISFFINSETNKYSYLKINDMSVTNGLFLVVSGYKVNYIYSLIGFLISFILLFYLSNKFFKKNECFFFKKIKKYVFVLELIVSIIFTYCFYYFILQYYFYAENFIIYLLLCIILFSILIIILSAFLSSKSRKYEKIFLALAIPIGLVYLGVLIPGRVADENAHYYRIYDISMGNIFRTEKGNIVPKKMFKDINMYTNSYKEWNSKISTSKEYKKIIYQKGPADGYFPGNYVFSSFGIFLARIIGLSPYLGFYLARFFNYLFYLFMGYYIIKYIPFKKLLALVYLMNPMLIHQAVSLSADSVINSVSILFIVYIFHLKYKDDNISYKNIIILCILALGVILGKSVYSLLLLLLILLISKYKKLDKKKKKFAITMLLIVLALGFCWLFKGKLFNHSSISKGISVINERKLYLMNNPLNIIIVLYNTIIKRLSMFVLTFCGNGLGWIDIEVNVLLPLIYLFILFISIYIDNSKIELNRNVKIFLRILFLFISLAMLFGIYISWNQPDLTFIDKVQGRYFIPYAIILFISFGYRLKQDNLKNIDYKLIILLFLINIGCILSIIEWCL